MVDDIESVLMDAPFLDICSKDQIRLLAFASEPMRFSAGEVIFSAGDAADGAYALVSGTVTIFDEGDPKGYRLRDPKSLIGELGLMIAGKRRTTVKAETRVEAVFVPRSAFAKLMREYPEIAEAAADRIREELKDYVAALSRFGKDKAD